LSLPPQAISNPAAASASTKGFIVLIFMNILLVDK